MPAVPRSDEPQAGMGRDGVSAGVMYSCFGEHYMAEAVSSAGSSLRHNRLPHVLFAAGEVRDPPEGLSVVQYVPTSGAPFVDRIANMRRSPFERTLYLDTDTYVVDDVTDILAVLDHYDLALALAPGQRGLEDPEVPRAFAELNCGVVAWRASPRVAAFLRSWEETHREWLAAEKEPLKAFNGDPHPSRTGIGDQPAFRRCAWQHGMHVYVLPPEYNLRVGYTTTVVGRVHVIHGRAPDYEVVARRINERIVPRTFPRQRRLKNARKLLVQWMRESAAERSPAPLVRRRLERLRSRRRAARSDGAAD